MRARLLLFAIALLSAATAACSSDDPVGIFAGERAANSGSVITETDDLDIDLSALEDSAPEEPASEDSALEETALEETALEETEQPPEIVIPDNALDLTGFAAIDIDIQDNAFVQRVVVVSPGTEITWTNQGRNEHNVRPSIEGAFEPISTLALAAKGDSASLTFDSPGDFPYFCSLHGTATNGQTGRVIVVP